MPLTSSGAISLDDMHQEVGGSANSNCSINDADIRGLIGASDGSSNAFDDWYGASAVTPRGLFMGGVQNNDANVDVVDYITIASAGNATDFGNLSSGRAHSSRGGGCGSATRGLIGGGNGRGGGATNTLRGGYDDDTIEYFTFATLGNATDFGNLNETKEDLASCSSATRGIFSGGLNGAAGADRSNVIDYVTIASTGNTTDFGDMIEHDASYPGIASHGGGGGTTRGIFAAGSYPDQNIIQYITIASTGNATDFGDTRAATRRPAIGSSNTRYIMAAMDGNLDDGDAFGYAQEAEYVTIASTGNGTDFGNLASGDHNSRAGTSNSLRMVIGGGSGVTNEIEYLTIANTGNGTDFGDLTLARSYLTSGSSEHGGL